MNLPRELSIWLWGVLIWVQVVPSLLPEPFGTVFVEAMMHGTAVIVSASVGLSKIIQNMEEKS